MINLSHKFRKIVDFKKTSWCYLPLVLLFSSCTPLGIFDFTPRLNKEILKAQTLILEQKHQQAIFIYETILKESPEDEIKVKIYYQLGDLFSINLSQNKKAIMYYEKIHKVTADPLWLVKSEERIGEVSFTYLRDYKQSVKSYEKLSSFKPRLKKFDFYEYRMALSLLNNKNYKKSEENFIRISKLANHTFKLNSLYQLGHLYFEQKKWKQAISAWDRYLEKENKRENIVRTKFLLANAYETIEQLKKAYDLYYSILGDYPHSELVQSRLESIYERRVARKR
jgi:tetratricopeptide (TPR) repeat protein